ncbi:MAG TPA: cupin domain-containing protein [Drouetiella sp.]|jgi:uncharacterized protein
MTAEELKAILDLKPLPREGGYFKETFRGCEVLSRANLPARYDSDKSTLTSIFYMLDESTFSAFHRLKSDEIYHFYLGDPVHLVLIKADGQLEQITLGQNILAGQHLQFVVPRGVWQASILAPGGNLALMGCTVAPGFDFDDYEHGEKHSLCDMYPAHRSVIEKLTRTESDVH